MRTLVLLRGSAGVGKSTYIEQNGLKQYTLSADDIRLLCQSPVMQLDGSMSISQNNEKVVWDILFKLLEVRMQRGEFTVIDATNSKTSEMNNYKKLADKYRYRMFCIDFTDVPIEEYAKRNDLNFEVASNYFNHKCIDCNKKIKHKDVLGMNMKFYGRNLEKFKCKKCLMGDLGIDKDSWNKYVEDFKSQGCKLF